MFYESGKEERSHTKNACVDFPKWSCKKHYQEGTIMSEKPYHEFCADLFNPDKHFEKPEALDDIKVLDITNYILGPEVPQYLAMFGAEVIKVEWPAGKPFGT